MVDSHVKQRSSRISHLRGFARGQYPDAQLKMRGSKTGPFHHLESPAATTVMHCESLKEKSMNAKPGSPAGDSALEMPKGRRVAEFRVGSPIA